MLELCIPRASPLIRVLRRNLHAFSHRPTKKRRRETQRLRSHTQENMLKVKIAADVRSFLVSFHRSRCYSAESVFAKKFRKQMPVV